MPRGDKSKYTDKQKRKAGHRRRIRRQRRFEEGSQEPRVGDRQQGIRRWQEERQRTWQDGKPQRIAQRWKEGRQQEAITVMAKPEVGKLKEPMSPMPAQHQPKPGIEAELEPRPNYLAPLYKAR